MYTTEARKILSFVPFGETSQTSSLPSCNILAQNATLGKGFESRIFAQFQAPRLKATKSNEAWSPPPSGNIFGNST